MVKLVILRKSLLNQRWNYIIDSSVYYINCWLDFLKTVSITGKCRFFCILGFLFQEKGEALLLMTEERLRHTLIPQYQQLFSKIGRLEGGVKFLVDMRADILVRIFSFPFNLSYAKRYTEIAMQWFFLILKTRFWTF